MEEKRRKHILISATAAVTCSILFLLLKEILIPKELMNPEETLIPEEITSPEETISPEEEITPEEVLLEETIFLEGIMIPKVIRIPKERNISWWRTDGEIIWFWNVEDNPYMEYQFPEKLAQRIAASLEEGDWEEKLQEIEIESKVLSRAEKREYFTEQEAEDYGGLAYYCIEMEPLLLKDKWYLVSLSDFGDDIVIESYDMKGDKCIYYFENFLNSHVYTESPLWTGRNPIGSPYFIEWDEKKYMAVPVFKNEGGEILGIEIHDYNCKRSGYGVVTGIRVDEEGECIVKSQIYYNTSPSDGPEGAHHWPTVLYEEEWED